MKFKTFRCIALLVVLVVIGLVGYKITHLPPSQPAPVADTYTPPPQQPVVTYTPIPVVRYTPPQPAYQPPVVVQYVPPQPVYTPPPVQTVRQPSVDELKSKIGTWLKANTYRHGKTQWGDFLPSETFRATALRFKKEDAVKFSDNEGQWSQIKIAYSKSGPDNEKWLLKNGGLYKREVLGVDGKTVTYTEWFNK